MSTMERMNKLVLSDYPWYKKIPYEEFLPGLLQSIMPTDLIWAMPMRKFWQMRLPAPRDC